MIIVLKRGATKEQINHILKKIESLGLRHMVSKGVERTIIGVIGEEDILRVQPLEVYPGVEKVMPVLAPYKLVSREFKQEDSVIDIKGIKIGGKKIVVIAGPCAVEEKELLISIAKKVKAAGATILRGGAFKPRTSPYSFQGLGKKGLEYLKAAREETGLAILTEVMDTRDVELVAEYADILQIGARNMQNFNLLKEVGKYKKPVLLKRGISATLTELFMSAEYILSSGNKEVILCERGIRTFEDATRNTVDISAIGLVEELSHLPIIVDPSHATGRRSLIAPVSRAAIAAGADGLLIEVHTHPEEALSDGAQSLLPRDFEKLMKELGRVAEAVGRSI
ncbi:3-deoxy-7-phosphoheptulonate synthase [bacterium]|nr:3-deoxy-7-phosphoheptulonate synthase [bacterium]MCG2676922.1 3-deoxy-7-phosphoheptulonate synthase [bacterium]